MGMVSGVLVFKGSQFWAARFIRFSSLDRFLMVFPGVKKSKLQNEKTMVRFGRTELSLSLSCTEFRALSHGHGFRGPCSNGVRKSWVFHDFWAVLFGPFFRPFQMS